MWAEDWFNGELCLCNNSSSPALTLWHKHLAQSNSRAQVLDSVENKPTVSWFSQSGALAWSPPTLDPTFRRCSPFSDVWDYAEFKVLQVMTARRQSQVVNSYGDWSSCWEGSLCSIRIKYYLFLYYIYTHTHKNAFLQIKIKILMLLCLCGKCRT